MDILGHRTGFISFWALIALTLIMSGNPQIFINIPSAVIVFGLTTSLALMAFGVREVNESVRTCFSIMALGGSPERLKASHPETLRTVIGFAYASGAMGFLIGSITMLTWIENISEVAPAFAVALIAPFYALLLAEGVLRPAARRVERALAECDTLMVGANGDRVTDA